MKTKTLLLTSLVLAAGVLPTRADGTTPIQKTVAEYSEILQRDSKDVASLVGRGEAYMRAANGRAALNDFNRTLQIEPKNIDALAGRGMILVASKQPEMTIAEISPRMAQVRADGEEKRAAKLFGARGAAFLALGRYDEALLDFNQAIENDSQPEQNLYCQNADWFQNRAVIWQAKGDDAHALADLNVAAQLNPAFAEKFKTSKFGKDLKPHAPDAAVILKNGDTAVFHKLKGNEWAAAAEMKKAVAEFEKAIALDPKYADAYNNLGLAKMDLGDLESAQKSMDKAIALKADDPRFYFNRSTLHLKQQRAADAVADAKKATELDANNADFWKSLALAQQMNEEYSGAEASLQTALKLLDGKGSTVAVRAKILTVRALQNIAPTKEEMYSLFYETGAKTWDIEAFADALNAELKIHPDVAALVVLRDAVVAERDRKKPYFIP